MKKSTITLIILDVLAIACFLLAYGPNDWFNTYFITTAMHTKSHRYLAKILYSDEEISKVMQSNQTIVVSEVTDTSLINFDINNDSSDVVYDNIYEE